MIERVLLVAWKGSSATSWVETLKSGGYTVLLEDTTGERAWRTAKERGIDVVIIDGQKKPSHGRQTGHALRDTAKTRNIPIIWTNLDTEDSASVQADVKPDMTLIAPTDASSALAALQALHAEKEAAQPSFAPELPVAAVAVVELAPVPPPLVAEPEQAVEAMVAPEPVVQEVTSEAPPEEPAKKAVRKSLKRAVAAKKATKKPARAKRPASKKKSAAKKPAPRKAAGRKSRSKR